MHALSARPLKVQGGRECDMHADGMESDKHYRRLIRQPTAATFSRWRRLARCPRFLKIKSRISTLGDILSIQSARMFLISLLQWQKVARFTATDEVLHVYCAKQILSHNVRTHTFAKTPTPSLGDADTHASRMCQFPSTTRMVGANIVRHEKNSEREES